MTERTEQYYECVKNYRKSLRDIWESYDIKLKRLERYRGSDGFEEDLKQLEQERTEAIKGLQANYKAKFDTIVRGMREAAKERTMTPPTQEQLAILTALRMRDSVSRDELEQAANTLRGCPVALGVLEEIAEREAKKNGGKRYGLRFEGTSTAGIMKCIDALADSAARICALNKCDSRKEMALHANYGRYDPDGNGIQSLFAFRTDKDVNDTAECLEFFGGVKDIGSFEDAVNEY